MKKFIGCICRWVFLGVSSALVLFVLLFALCGMMAAEASALQVAAVALALCLIVAYIAGAVLALGRLLRRGRNTSRFAGSMPGADDCVTKKKP